MRTKLYSGIAAVAATALLVGCSNSPTEKATDFDEVGEVSRSGGAETETRTIVDGMGRTVEIPVAVETIVPLGNAPRMATYVGCADKAVGIGGHRNPEDITPVTAYEYANKDLWADLPIVGTDFKGETDYFPEEIVALGPDVILTTYNAELADEIQSKTKIPVVSVDGGTTGGPAANLFAEEYNDALMMIADVCGTTDRAEEVVDFLNENLADLDERTAGIPIDQKPLILGAAASSRGFHGIESVYVNYPVFDAVHADNAAAGISDQTGGVTIDREQILVWDPEYIFLDSAGVPLVVADYQENPDFYNQLQAVRNGNVYQHPSSTSMFSNVEIPLANAYFIGNLTSPEQFSDVDFRDKANEIFKFFIGADDHYGSLEEYGEGYIPIVLGDQ